MLKNLLPSLIQPKDQEQSQSQPSGFTLTELLVTIIIGSIITSTLLWLIVNLLNTSQRESALSETQRDMQRTLDYIAADMKEAVYVYDGSCHPTQTTVCPSYYRAPGSTDANTAFLPDFASGDEDTNNNGILDSGEDSNDNGYLDTEIPVLAFWKTDPVSLNALPAICTDMSTDALDQECASLKKRRHSYTLVVYTQDTTNTGNTWSGNARIQRYELTKYPSNSPNGTTLARNKGYVDPAEAGSGSFRTWPYSGTTNLQTFCSSNCVKGAITVSGNGGTAEVTAGNYAVVTDFVDLPNPGNLTVSCPIEDTGDGDYADEGEAGDEYLVTPRQGGTFLSYTFYACVRNVEGEIGRNQDVAIYLRGNIDGRGGFAGTDGPLPVLQTQITMRGVIEK